MDNKVKVLNKTRILFIHALKVPFILNDISLLSEFFDVKILDLSPYSGSTMKKLKYAPRILVEMIKGILWSHVTFSWFADIHAFLAVLFSKILGRKSVVVVGGYEVVMAPEIRYGGMLSSRKARMIRFILRHADKILAVSRNNMSEILRWVNRDIELIYNCVDCDRFKPEGTKENLVITVGRINKLTLKRKGIETFVKSARHLPHVSFVVIGGWSDSSIEYLKSIAPQNVEFTGFVSEEELVKWYQKAKVYCQLSFYEAFGVSLAEAMACECIPVVTNRGAIPEVVGDCGFYVPYGDEKAAAEAIKKALNAPEELGRKARERIKNLFSKNRREAELVRVIEGLYEP